MAKITSIEGVGFVLGQKLNRAGVSSVEALLGTGGTKSGRRKLADETGISMSKLLRLVNHADLMRIRGIGGQYSELLEAAGVDSVPELACRNATNLHTKMAQINSDKKLVRLVAPLTKVEDWVVQAKILPKAVTH